MAIIKGFPELPKAYIGDAICGACCGSSLQTVDDFANPYGISIAEGKVSENYKPIAGEVVDVIETKSGILTISSLTKHRKTKKNSLLNNWDW